MSSKSKLRPWLRRPLWPLPFSLVLLAPAATGQEETPPIFSEVIEVRVVNIEVVVTDRSGQRVAGLNPEDFRLLVDGEEVPIEFFTEVADGKVTEAPAEDDATQPVPALTAGNPAGVSYLVFIDEFFAIARDRNRVLRALEEDLPHLGLRDRMAVVAFDGQNLDLLTDWTQSAEDLRRTFQAAKARRSHGLRRLAERRSADLERRTLRGFTAGSGLGTRLGPQGYHYATQLSYQVERSVLAAVTALRSFVAPQGRKVMLLLSGGWPFSPAEYTVSSVDATYDETLAGVFDSRVPGRDRLLEPLSDTANLLGYTLYPVDVPGLGRESIADASRSRPRGFNQVGGFPREDQLHASLGFLAQRTGGQALLNSRHTRALEIVAEDTRSYYWLGFTPQRQEDNERHSIEVKVNRPGLRVRSRQGFVDLSRQTEVTMMVEGSLLLGAPPGTLPLELRFGPPRRSGLGKVHVPLAVGIPLEEITLLPANDRFVGEVEIRVTVMDGKGNRSETPLVKVPINGSRQPEAGEQFWYETTLSMRRRTHRIVVAVTDPLSGTTLSSLGDVSP